MTRIYSLPRPKRALVYADPSRGVHVEVEDRRLPILRRQYRNWRRCNSVENARHYALTFALDWTAD